MTYTLFPAPLTQPILVITRLIFLGCLCALPLHTFATNSTTTHTTTHTTKNATTKISTSNTSNQTQTPEVNPYVHCEKPFADLPDKIDTSWVDQTHANMSTALCRQVNKIDNFFGDIETNKHARSFVLVRLGYQWEQLDESSSEFQPSVKARVRLPNISKHLNLLISDDENDDNTIPTTKPSTQQDLHDETSRLGKLLGITRSDPVDYDFDVGSKSDDGPKLFLRGRSTWQFWPSETSSLQLSQSLFWLDGLGYGEESRLEYNQKLDTQTLFRWTTAAEFSEETEGLQIQQNLLFFKQIDAQRGLSYDLQVIGETRPTLKVTEYGVRVLFRRNFLKPWLFYELEPSIFWPLEYDRDMSLRVLLRLEIQLGNIEPQGI